MDKATIAIVGLNFGRHIIASQFNNDGPASAYFHLTTVCSQDREQNEKTAKQYNLRAVDDMEILLRDPAIKAIGLYTGPVGRAELIRRCIRAGKHVMTTKPFEADSKAALEVLREARQLGRVVHLNSPNPVLPPDLAQIEKWQEEYDLGRPLACRADVWANYREKPDGSWYDDPLKCPAAPLFRLGIYLINDLTRFFGPAQSVQVFSSRLFTGRPTDDHAQLSIRYANGSLANVFGSFCIEDGEHYKNSLTLNFERGTAYRNQGPRPLEIPATKSRMQMVKRGAEKNIIVENIVDTGSGNYQWHAFYDAIHGKDIGPTTTPEQVAQSLRVVEAMSRSVQSGQVVSVE